MKRLVLCILFGAVNAVTLEDQERHHPRLGFLAATNSSEDPDAEARDAFVKKCILTVSVRKDKHLPVDAVESFCQETDAIVECRNNFVSRLGEAHDSGAPALKSFCNAIYNWFQTKYGMFCPQQCSKLQCKSTCEWLKISNELKEENVELQAALSESENSRTQLVTLSSKNQELAEEVRRMNRTFEQAQVDIERREQQRIQAAEVVRSEQSKMEAAKNKTKSMTDILAAVSSDLKAKKDNLVELKRDIEMAEVKHTGKAREIESITKQIEAKSEKVKRLEDEIAAGETNKDKLLDAAEKQAAKAREAAAATAEQMSVVAAKNASLQRAQDKYEASTAAGDPETAIENYKSLVGTQRERLREAEAQLAKMKFDQRAVETAVGHAQQEIEAFEADVNDTMVAIQGIQASIDNLTSTRDALQEATDSSVGSEITRLTSEADNLTQVIADTEKEQVKASKTLDFTQQAEEEQGKILAKAEAELSEANTRAQNAAQAFTAAESNLGFKRIELEQGLAEETRLRQAYESENGALDRRAQEFRDAVAAHDRAKPEIVKLHGLGLLQKLITP